MPFLDLVELGTELSDILVMVSRPTTRSTDMEEDLHHILLLGPEIFAVRFAVEKLHEDMLPRHVVLTVFPQVLDEVAGGVVKQSRHIVIQRIHVLGQPIICIIVDLEV